MSFATLPGVDRPTPETMIKVSARVAAELAMRDVPALPAACRSRSATLTIAGRTVGILQERKAGDATRFRATLAFDRAVTDIATGLDILPTLAALIGLSIPADEIDGRCIDLDPGPGDTCEGIHR
jgi:hypothetical protein